MFDRGYVTARKVLLDALEALHPYGRETVIVVGAQAIYLRCKDSESIVSPFTLDSDLVLDLDRRISNTPIRQHLESLGYALRDNQPGLYRSPNVPADAQAFAGVDLFVPAAYAIGTNRRDANIPSDPRAARRQRGLELCVVERSLMTVQALDPGDARAIDASVAGPFALLIAKLVKLRERFAGDGSRIEAKDILDVYRLLYSHTLETFTNALERFRKDTTIAPIVRDAFATLDREFTGQSARALILLEQYLADYPIKAEIVEATRLLSEELVTAVDATPATGDAVADTSTKPKR